MAIADLHYIQAAGDGGQRSSTQVIVIHATDNTASAEAESSYAAHRADKTSAHLYVDGDSAVRCLPLGDVAYGCLPHGNAISVQIELSGRSNQITDATLREAAPLVAELCRMYGIPAQKIGPADVQAGRKGIVGHADITLAFPQDHGDHTDPGPAFPWATFLGYVNLGGSFMSALTDAEQRELFDRVTAMFEGLPTGPGSKNAEWQWETMLEAWERAADAKLAALQTSLDTLTDVARALVAAMGTKAA